MHKKDKLGGPLEEFTDKVFLPYMYKHLKDAGYEATPYVNAWGQTPDKGFVQFPDWPRYSTGYAALFHAIGVMTETQMLKPYNKRVEATYAYLLGNIKFLSAKRTELLRLRKETKEAVKTQKEFAVSWQVNKEKKSEIEFKGYEPEYVKSKASDTDRFSYNRSKPFTKQISFFDTYETLDIVQKPVAYIIPQGYFNVIELLKLSGIQMQPLEKDLEIEVEAYDIESYE